MFCIKGVSCPVGGSFTGLSCQDLLSSCSQEGKKTLTHRRQKNRFTISKSFLFKTLLLTEGTHCLLLHGWLDNAGTWDKVGYSYKQATRRSSSGGIPPNIDNHIYFIFSIYHILHRWCPSSTLSSTWWLSTCLAMASLLISPPVISFSKGAFIKYLFFLGRPSLS